MKFGVGQPVLRIEDSRLIIGQGRYTDDIDPGTGLGVAFLRAPLAHARLLSVDTSAAAAMDGVLLVGGAPWWTIACMAIAGASIGPIDVAMFSMLQRTVPPDRLARSNAVALMVVALGIPIGAVIGGLVAAAKPSAALALAPLMAVIAATIGKVLLRESPQMTPPARRYQG